MSPQPEPFRVIVQPSLRRDFTKSPNGLLERTDLAPGPKLLYLLLQHHEYVRGAPPTTDTLCAQLGCHRNSLAAWRDTLTQSRLLLYSRGEGRGRPSLYRLFPDANAPFTMTTTAPPDPPADGPDAPGFCTNSVQNQPAVMAPDEHHDRGLCTKFVHNGGGVCTNFVQVAGGTPYSTLKTSGYATHSRGDARRERGPDQLTLDGELPPSKPSPPLLHRPRRPRQPPVPEAAWRLLSAWEHATETPILDGDERRRVARYAEVLLEKANGDEAESLAYLESKAAAGIKLLGAAARWYETDWRRRAAARERNGNGTRRTAPDEQMADLGAAIGELAAYTQARYGDVPPLREGAGGPDARSPGHDADPRD